MLVFIQYCEVLRHVLLHVIMSILCFVEMTDLTSEQIYCHVWVVVIIVVSVGQTPPMFIFSNYHKWSGQQD